MIGLHVQYISESKLPVWFLLYLRMQLWHVILHGSVDALLYLAEGFLPLVYVFYTKYFDLSTCSQSAQKRIISEKICDTLLVSHKP